jgi:hypothetical protein
MGPCTVNRTSVDGLVTLTYQSGSVYSAYYDADGDIEVVRFVCEMQAANRFRPESDEHTLLLESETRMTVAWEAGSQRQSSSITARLALAQNRGDESNSYTGTAYYSGGGVTIDETEVGDENVTALLDALSVEVFLKQARDVLQLPFMTPAGSQYEHGNQRARCVRTGVLYARASGASLLEARGVVMSGPYTPGAPVLAVEWGDSPTQYGIMGRFTQHIFAPRCFGFVQYDLTPEADGRNYRLGAIVTPTQTLPAETAPGSWETRKRYVAWRPVTGEVLQDVNPCAWF